MSDLEQYAKEHQVPIMMDGGLKFLLEKLQEKQCLSFLELGTAIARTSIEVAKLDPRMKVVTIERNPDMIVQAKKNIEESGLSDQITLIEGDALEVDVDGMFDCIFIDAAKGQYPDYLQKVLPLLADDGIILADNVLFRGYVMSEEKPPRRYKTIVKRLREYIAMVSDKDKFTTEIFENGDGLALTKRLKTN